MTASGVGRSTAGVVSWAPVVVAIALAAAGVEPALGQQASVRVVPAAAAVASGATLTVELRADVGVAAGGGAVFLRFPADRLRFVDGRNNVELWNGVLFNAEPRVAQAGVVALSVGANSPGVSGEGLLLASLRFVGLLEGEAELTLLAVPGREETVLTGLDLAPLPTSVSGATVTVTAAMPPGAKCIGDCSGDGMVTIDELIVGVRIALGELPSSGCGVFDADANGDVTVDELVAAVDRALSGCPAGER